MKKKSVFVIGGASGIGRATAEKYLTEGNYVTVLDNNKETIHQMKKEHERQADRIIFCEGDVRNHADIDRSIVSLTEAFDRIDVLVYSAGIFPDHSVLKMTEEDWDNVIDINLKGAFLCCKKVASKMIGKKTKGHIITISSGSYRSGRVGSAHYCASKAGLVMFTKVLAMELAPFGIKVNSISPGLIDNPIIDSTYKDMFTSRIPMGRIGEPQDIASFISAFTSMNNEYITGQVIAIDGGLSAGQFGLPMSNKN